MLRVNGYSFFNVHIFLAASISQDYLIIYKQSFHKICSAIRNKLHTNCNFFPTLAEKFL